jgi:hypothetical protein
VVSFNKKLKEPFQLFVVGKVDNPFHHDRRQLEWLQSATLANPAKNVQPFSANQTA